MSLDRRERSYSGEERKVSFSLPRDNTREKKVESEKQEPFEEENFKEEQWGGGNFPATAPKHKKKWKIKLPWGKNKKEKFGREDIDESITEEVGDFENEENASKTSSSSESTEERSTSMREQKDTKTYTSNQDVAKIHSDIEEDQLRVKEFSDDDESQSDKGKQMVKDIQSKVSVDNVRKDKIAYYEDSQKPFIEETKAKKEFSTNQDIFVEVMEDFSDGSVPPVRKSRPTTFMGFRLKKRKQKESSFCYDSSFEVEAILAGKKGGKTSKMPSQDDITDDRAFYNDGMNNSHFDDDVKPLSDSEQDGGDKSPRDILGKRFSDSKFVEHLNFIEVDEPNFSSGFKDDNGIKKSNSLPSFFFKRKKKEKRGVKKGKIQARKDVGSVENLKTEGTPGSSNMSDFSVNNRYSKSKSTDLSLRSSLDTLSSSPDPRPNVRMKSKEIRQAGYLKQLESSGKENRGKGYNNRKSKVESYERQTEKGYAARPSEKGYAARPSEKGYAARPSEKDYFGSQPEYNSPGGQIEKGPLIGQTGKTFRDRKADRSEQHPNESVKFIDHFNFKKTSTTRRHLDNKRAVSENFKKISSIRTDLDNKKAVSEEFKKTPNIKKDFDSNRPLSEEFKKTSKTTELNNKSSRAEEFKKTSNRRANFDKKTAVYEEFKKMSSTRTDFNKSVLEDSRKKRNTRVDLENNISRTDLDKVSSTRTNLDNTISNTRTDLVNKSELSKELKKTSSTKAYVDSKRAASEELLSSQNKSSDSFTKSSSDLRIRRRSYEEMLNLIDDEMFDCESWSDDSSDTDGDQVDLSFNKLLQDYQVGTPDSFKLRRVRDVDSPISENELVYEPKIVKKTPALSSATGRRSPNLKRPSGAPPPPPQTLDLGSEEEYETKQKERTKRRKLKKVKKVRVDMSSSSSLEGTPIADKRSANRSLKIGEQDIERNSEKREEKETQENDLPPDFPPPPIPDEKVVVVPETSRKLISENCFDIGDEDKLLNKRTSKNDITLPEATASAPTTTGTTIKTTVSSTNPSSASGVAKDLYTKRENNKRYSTDYKDLYLTNLPVKNIKSATARLSNSPPPSPPLPPLDDNPCSGSRVTSNNFMSCVRSQSLYSGPQLEPVQRTPTSTVESSKDSLDSGPQLEPVQRTSTSTTEPSKGSLDSGPQLEPVQRTPTSTGEPSKGSLDSGPQLEPVQRTPMSTGEPSKDSPTGGVYRKYMVNGVLPSSTTGAQYERNKGGLYGTSSSYQTKFSSNGRYQTSNSFVAGSQETKGVAKVSSSSRFWEAEVKEVTKNEFRKEEFTSYGSLPLFPSQESKKSIVTFHLPPINAGPQFEQLPLSVTYQDLPTESHTWPGSPNAEETHNLPESHNWLESHNSIGIPPSPQMKNSTPKSPTADLVPKPPRTFVLEDEFKSPPLVQRHQLVNELKRISSPELQRKETGNPPINSTSSLPRYYGKTYTEGTSNTLVKATGPIPYSKKPTPLKSILRNKGSDSLKYDSHDVNTSLTSNPTTQSSSHRNQVTSIYQLKEFNRLINPDARNQPIFNSSVERVEISDTSESDLEMPPPLPTYPPPPNRLSALHQEFLGHLLLPTTTTTTNNPEASARVGLPLQSTTTTTPTSASHYVPTIVEGSGQRGQWESIYQNVVYASQV